MKIKLSFVLVLFAKIALCQLDESDDIKFSVKLAPLGLIDLYDGPCYRISSELKIYKNISMSLEYGGYIPVGATHYYWKEHSKGCIIKPEIRFYLNKQEITAGEYISVEYFYKKLNYDFWGEVKPDSANSYIKEYNMRKEISCFNIKYGGEYSTDNFIMEAYIGAGVRFTNASDDLADWERGHLLLGEDQGGVAGGFIRSTGFYILPSIAIGFRIGYRIK